MNVDNDYFNMNGVWTASLTNMVLHDVRIENVGVCVCVGKVA